MEAAVTLADQPWWTPADQAELEALTWALADAYHEHREHCLICRKDDWGKQCPQLREAIQIVLDWRQSRILHSKARYLRLAAELAHVQEQLAALDAGREAA